MLRRYYQLIALCKEGAPNSRVERYDYKGLSALFTTVEIDRTPDGLGLALAQMKALGEQQRMFAAMSRKGTGFLPLAAGVAFNSLEEMAACLEQHHRRIEKLIEQAVAVEEYHLRLQVEAAPSQKVNDGKSYFMSKYAQHQSEVRSKKMLQALHMQLLQAFPQCQSKGAASGQRLSLLMEKGSLNALKHHCNQWLRQAPNACLNVDGPWPPYLLANPLKKAIE